MCSPESALEAAFTRYARGYLSFCTKQLLMIKYIWTPKSHPHFKAFIFIIPLFLHYCSLPVRVLYTCNFSWWAVSCALMQISKKPPKTLRQIDCNPSRPSAAGWMSVGWRAVGGMPPKLELGFFWCFFKKKEKVLTTRLHLSLSSFSISFLSLTFDLLQSLPPSLYNNCRGWRRRSQL